MSNKDGKMDILVGAFCMRPRLDKCTEFARLETTATA